MARPKRRIRARTLERQARVASEKLFLARNKLIELAPGGTQARPIDVPTAALVEPKAEAVACPRCGEPFAVESHEARTSAHGRLREVTVLCKFCATRRSLWFRIVAPS
jgi:formylmethanofuran dehydrogenase subunit E